MPAGWITQPKSLDVSLMRQRSNCPVRQIQAASEKTYDKIVESVCQVGMLTPQSLEIIACHREEGCGAVGGDRSRARRAAIKSHLPYDSVRGHAPHRQS